MPTCTGVRQEFIECILNSDCVLIKRNSVQDCVKNKGLKEYVPEKCRLLGQSLFECKRGLVRLYIITAHLYLRSTTVDAKESTYRVIVAVFLKMIDPFTCLRNRLICANECVVCQTQVENGNEKKATHNEIIDRLIMDLINQASSTVKNLPALLH